MSQATRVFVKKAKAKGAKKDRWPKRQKGPKYAKVLIELPTTTPKIGVNSVGQFCVEDGEVLKFIQKRRRASSGRSWGMVLPLGSLWTSMARRFTKGHHSNIIRTF